MKVKLLYSIPLLILLLGLILPSVTIIANSQASKVLTIGWVTSSPYTSLSSYNPNIFSGGLGGAFYGLVYAYSAILNVSNNQMLPGIVENWTFSPSNWIQEYNSLSSVNVTLYLNPNAHWANGQPVTAYDILATCLILDMYSAPPFPNYTVINNYTIIISYPKDYVSPYLMPFTLLNTVGLGEVAVITNYQVWKPIITQIEGNWTLLQEGKVKTTVFRNMIRSFNPALVAPISASYNGPFYVSQITPSEIVLSKNPGFYAVNMVPWNEVIIYQYTSSQDLLAGIKTGEIGLLYSGATSLPSLALSSLPSYYKVVSVPQPFGYALYFNLQNPWLKYVQVRQAIAYIINRTAIALVGGVKYSPVHIPNGIPNFSYFNEFRSPAVSNLNPYNVNLTKAAELLESVGFTEKNGQWYTPSGTPFTLNITDTSTSSPGVDSMLTLIADELTAFGIPTTYSIITIPSVAHQLYETGDYDLAFQNWGGYYPGTVDWYLQLQYLSGIPYNVTHWDLLVPLPNGSVYNMSKLYIESTAPNSTSQLIAANDEIAYALNYYLPLLPLVYSDYVIVYNSNVLSAPPSNSWFWEEALYGIGGTAFLQAGFQYGYLVSTTITTTTTTTVPTVTSIVTSTTPPSTVTVSSTNVGLIVGVAVAVIIVIIIVAVILLRRR
ncbi:ABC transporter substrate-binding protein [Sulfolobus sp. S-194]|uniref:ABC transporter substrate-binding protein n=1 Tax=Sulfolobus sp. S-194 TaxID=2512240 RepID=UPI0014372B38|nr:ABC transporter substrate-binding protein [Sulfolobus sp. S-194]QIW25274.1 ABC transporter substrate-binding protein [Sulfolobus sp. S-194]